MGIASISITVASSVSSVVGVVARIAAASNLLRATELAAAGLRGATGAVDALTTVGRLASIGRLAGRASAILTIVTVGLDIGLSVAQLENQKQALEENINTLASGITEARQLEFDIENEKIQIGTRIEELLRSVRPPVPRSAWLQWVADQKRDLQVTVDSINRSYALALARNNRTKPLADRISELKAVLSLTDEQAKAFITEADRTPG
jgi:hypothetical protein